MTTYPEAVERYREFREAVFTAHTASRVSEGEPVSPSTDELQAQAKWFSGEYGRQFTGVDGEAIEIVQFGHWNHSAGPDFTECAARIDGVLLSGAIEVDPSPRCWEQHGHGSNPVYDDTLLHVCLDHERSGATFFTRTSQHRQVPQVFLGHPDSMGETPALRGTLPEAKRGRCATPLQHISTERLDSLLEAAAQYRLFGKARRHQRMIRAHGMQQALYQGIGEALGYRHNKLCAAVLTQRLPLRSLRDRSQPEREALILGMAGFVGHDELTEGGSLEARDYLRSVWDSWWRLREDHEFDESRRLNWRLSGVRPSNHPQRRLGALATLIKDWPRFLRLIPGAVQPPRSDWVRPLRHYLTSLEHPFWSHHYTLRSKASSRKLALIGKDRVHDLVGNIVFPGVIHEHPREWQRYSQLPGSLINEKLRRAALRLFGDVQHPLARHSLKTFAQQQGLLQIFTDFCLEDFSECAECPFPEQLRQW